MRKFPKVINNFSELLLAAANFRSVYKLPGGKPYRVKHHGTKVCMDRCDLNEHQGSPEWIEQLGSEVHTPSEAFRHQSFLLRL